MARAHDVLVSFVASKIQRLGFEIKYMEGRSEDVTMSKPDLPPRLISHRPDVFGTLSTGAICIGEAKTAGDLKSKRTITQFVDFTFIVRENPHNRLIIGIPAGAKGLVVNLLMSAGITIDQQVDILEVPEQFLSRNE
jgi:hypothetical protein